MSSGKKKLIQRLSYLAIFLGVVFGCLGLTQASFKTRIEKENNQLEAGTLEIDLKDAFNSEISFNLDIGPIAPYLPISSYAKIKNTGSLPLLWKIDFNQISENCLIENKCLSDILQGEIMVERTLLDYLYQAKQAENDEEYQLALDEFVKKVKFLEQAGLISEGTKNKLILKSKILR